MDQDVESIARSAAIDIPNAGHLNTTDTPAQGISVHLPMTQQEPEPSFLHQDGGDSDSDGGHSGSDGEESYLRSIWDNPHIPSSARLSALAYGHEFRFPERANVCCYEVFPDRNQIKLIHDIGPRWSSENSAALERFWNPDGQVGSEVSLRLVIAEDISYDLINIIGSTCELDPVFFIQHLTGSNINNEAGKNTTADPFPDTFLDDSSNIFSLRWYRPVRRAFKTQEDGRREMPLISPELRDNKVGEGLWSFGLGSQELQKLAEEQLADKDTNIFRNSWYLGRPLRSRTAPSVQVPVAWEERVTIYREVKNGVECMVILSDPLPWITTEASTEPTRTKIFSFRSGRESRAPITRIEILPYQAISARWTYQVNKWTPNSTSWKYPKRPRTTHIDMINWMTNRCFNKVKSLQDRHSDLAMANPMQALFMVIYLDTMMLSELFDTALQDIRLASVGESELRRSIGAWRRMLTDAQLYLPDLQSTLLEFTKGCSLHVSPKLSKMNSRLQQTLTSLIANTEAA